LSIFFGGKVNLVGALGRSKFKILSVFKSAWKTNNKLRKYVNFDAKSVFDKIDFGFGVTL